MVKAVVGLIVIGVAVLAVVHFADTGNFDPAAQGQAAEEALNAIVPGATWTEVIDAVDNEPGRFAAINQVKLGLDDEGNPIYGLEVGHPTRFERDLFESTFDAGMPFGFVFYYKYNEQIAFKIEFDAAGASVSKTDTPTAANLFDTRR